MSVIAKMQCHENSGTARAPANKDDSPSCARIRLGAVFEGTPEGQAASENAIFGFWTPMGSVEMGICNPPAAEFFKPGKKYYVTFTEAPD